jgi:hypothetical protein
MLARCLGLLCAFNLIHFASPLLESMAAARLLLCSLG